MKKRKRRGWKRRHRGERGQSMVSYAVVTACLLGGLMYMSIEMIPRMLEAYNSFAHSMYFVINMPLP